MIKLEHIKRNENTVTCDAYVEDCKTAMPLALDVSKKEFEKYDFPAGYEWCRSHIAHAKRRLLKMIETDNFEKECLIMWY
ncbi:MAG: hypothetical protein LUG61_11100 [Lachnospiraceae bacterium]|nr:hypothetical protein [Lachnospiraceae bacterium]